HAFISSAFLCSGIIMDPVKEYSLEFVSGKPTLLADFEELLRDNGFEPKRAQRRYAGVLYFKASEQIEDLLT
ncbi:MAG: DNA-binding protein WhiA, partial [Pygmaiobacter sp.]